MIQKSNPRHSKSQYEKYIIMAHSQTHRLPLSYDGYLRFKELMEVINSISNSSSDSKQFLFGGEMLTKKYPKLKHLPYSIIFIMEHGMRLLKNVY